MNQPVPHNHVAIIGTGFGALAATVRLQQSGIDDVVLIERAGDVGGVWRDNAYPGAAVDVKSHLYSLSFAPNPDWHNVFAKQPELHAYLGRVVDDFDLRRRLVLDTEVTALHWQADQQRWRITTVNGERTAAHVVVATGALAEPVIPDLPGLENFAGEKFHSARWNHEFDLRRKKVAVIGTGASAIQFVPAIQPEVGKMTLFQRTAPWIMPRHDHAVSPRRRALFRKYPALQRLERTRIYFQFEWMILAFRNPGLMRVPQRRALRHLKNQVPDPVLRAKLTPDYRIGCKRILLSDNYLPAVSQPNVDVNTDGIREIRAHSVVDKQGVVRFVHLGYHDGEEAEIEKEIKSELVKRNQEVKLLLLGPGESGRSFFRCCACACANDPPADGARPAAEPLRPEWSGRGIFWSSMTILRCCACCGWS